jgi:hypothetical protein
LSKNNYPGGVLTNIRQWGAFIGSPFDRQSLKYFWLEQTIDGENLFVASSYKAILEAIAKPARAKAQIHLETTVTSISTTSYSEDQQVHLTISTSSTPLAFDAIILTSPLGCLKANTPQVSPLLPPRLRAAIANLSYGNLEKVYLTFPYAFWDSSPASPQPIFTHFLHPEYAGAQNPDAAIVEAFSMSALPSPHAHPTLLFYIHGPFAQTVVDSVRDLDADGPEYLATLAARFMPYYARLPHYDAEKRECRPVAATATTWGVDELAGSGSYSNFQIPRSEEVNKRGTEAELDRDVEVLRGGCPERGLWLAGEHTAPFVALGTVTGAYWSGEAVAKRVVEWFQGTSDVGTPSPEGVGGGREAGSKTIQIGKGHETGVGGMDIH